MFDDWGGVINSGPVTRGPIRLADLYRVAQKHAKVPVKVSVGAGPANLAWHVYFKHYKNAKELSSRSPDLQRGDEELSPPGRSISRSKTSAPGCRSSRATRTTTSGSGKSSSKCCDGVDAKIGWHFCFGNAWGNDILSANFPEGYQTVLPYSSTRRASTSSCSTTRTVTWPASSS